MAYILELECTTQQQYIKNIIITTVREFGISAKIVQQGNTLFCSFNDEDSKFSECLEQLSQKVPASLFLKSSHNAKNDEKIDTVCEIENEYPISIGLCPTCQKEMFDVSSRRYYYPFTSCSCCGGNYSFLSAYPYERKNTSFKFITPCKSCSDEMQKSGNREKHHINSCHECSVPVRLVNKSSERYANDAGSFRTMFEVAAKAIKDNKKLLMKTTFGYRLLYSVEHLHKDSILMMINASKITDYLSLITEEFNALLSIERPVLHVTLKDERLQELSGFNTAYVKYPDDGFSILLGAELQKIGVDCIAYEDVDADCDADMMMDYDLEVSSQKDMRIFLNKDNMFIAEGERVSFPSHHMPARNILSIGEEYIGFKKDTSMFFDKMEHFDSIKVETVNVLEGVTQEYHTHQKTVAIDEASFMSVIAEHNAFDKKCVGAYFDEEPSFLYYDGKKTLRVVPPKKFDGKNIIEDIRELREGSDRLIDNLQKNMPEVYKKLENLQNKEEVKLFEAVAILLGLEDESMRGVTKEAMKFVGKGGIQIDTHVTDNRFDHAAFLSSIISYQLADVSTAILAYSIFESFGDYFNDILQELKSKTKAEEIVLCGKDFANQSLFSRMQRNLKMTPPLMNLNYPIGKENTVVGGAYL